MASNDIFPGTLNNHELVRVARNAMFEDYAKDKPWTQLQMALLLRLEKLLNYAADDGR